MFTSINTIAVYVSEMEPAKKFYTEVLGFEVKHDLGPTLCFLISRSGDINVYLEAGYARGSVSKASTRLSFFLRTEKSVKETFDALKTAGISVLDDAPQQVGDGVFVFQFLDPDGNILEATGH